MVEINSLVKKNRDTPQKKECGDLVVGILESMGIDYIFGVPGGAIEPLYNALARSEARGGMRAIVARHEAGAAFMADGYTRETGKIGVCCATTGPGSTNLITGVAAAYADNIPMLVITAQTTRANFGRRALQDSSCTAVDTVAMFKECTRYSTLVSHKTQLQRKLITALMTAQRHPQGPVHLSIPKDILSDEQEDADQLHTQNPALLTQCGFNTVTEAQALTTLIEAFKTLKHPVFYLGHGCGHAIDLIREFAQLINAPIITDPAGKRWVNAFDPFYKGVFGYAGHESARTALSDPNTDAIIAVGTQLGELDTGSWDTLLLNEKLIHIDDCAENLVNSTMARFQISGDLCTIFNTLIKTYSENLQNTQPYPTQLQPGKDNHFKQISATNKAILPASVRMEDYKGIFDVKSPIKPQRLMTELSQIAPHNTRFVIDAGNSWAWSIHYLHLRTPGMFRIGFGFGSMGWGIGASVGTAIACRDDTVVCITGDGAYLMSGQEITVAVAEKLPMVFVVLNDQDLGMVKHGQRLGGAEDTAHELPPVNFAAMAEAMGARSFTLSEPADFRVLKDRNFWSHQGPTLLDVHIDTEEVPPMAIRMKTLTNDGI